MNKIIYFLPMLLLVISLNCEGQTSGLLIKRKNFIKKVSYINNKLATKDTSNILTFDCVEIIRILNTLRINGDKIWIKSLGDSIILNYFINEIESSSSFNKLLGKYMDRKLGDIELTSGLGVRYIEHDIYFGGREINDNSYYTMKKSIFRLK